LTKTHQLYLWISAQPKWVFIKNIPYEQFGMTRISCAAALVKLFKQGYLQRVKGRFYHYSSTHMPHPPYSLQGKIKRKPKLTDHQVSAALDYHDRGKSYSWIAHRLQCCGAKTIARAVFGVGVYADVVKRVREANQ